MVIRMWLCGCVTREQGGSDNDKLINESCVCRSCKIKLESACTCPETLINAPMRVNRTVVVLNDRTMRIRRMALEQRARKAILRAVNV